MAATPSGLAASASFPDEALWADESVRRDRGLARVLVVDDDAVSRVVLTRQLAPQYLVAVAGSGPEALETLASTRCDAVLLDVVMPDMNGYDACREIKARAQDSFLPVLMLTSLGDPIARHAGLEAGADDFLTKPIGERELHLRVEKLLRLRQQLDELKRIQRVKDELVALLVHDVRNPLQGVTAYLDLLRRRGIERPAYAELTEQCRRATERARGLLDDLLAVQLVESGNLTISRTAVDVSELLHASLESVASIGALRGMTFDVAIERDLHASLDRRFASRAIENVIINAIHHGGELDRIRIRAWRAGSDLVVEVADRGPGIPDAEKHRVFEKFASVESRRTKGRASYGVGLFLVKLATELHGGRASARDRHGGGTIFSLVFGSAVCG